MLRVLLAGLWAWAQASPAGQALTPEQIQERVQVVLDRGIPRATAESRNSFSARLSASLLRHPASERIPQLLEALPQALEFHSVQVQMWEIQSSIPGLPAVQLPQPLLEEGYQVQMDYLASRLDRALQADRSAPARERISEQIRTLTATAKDLLRPKLPGAAGSGLVDREWDDTAALWLKSLDMPFNQFLDAALPEEELHRILGRMKTAVEPFQPVTLSEAQAADPSVLRELGVSGLLARLMEAASESMTYCYRGFGDWDRRFQEWTVRAKASRNEAVQSTLGAYAPPRPDPAKPGLRKGSAEPPPIIKEFGRSPLERQPAKDPAASDPMSSRRWVVLGIGLLLVLVLMAFTLRQKRSS
jgi:hypothetical protein